MSYLRLEIDKYLRETGECVTALGRRAVNDPNVVRDIRNGRLVSARVEARIRAALTQSHTQPAQPVAP